MRIILLALFVALATNAFIVRPVEAVRLANDGDVWCNDTLQCAPIPDKMPIDVLYCNCLVCKARQVGTGGAGWWMLQQQLDMD